VGAEGSRHESHLRDRTLDEPTRGKVGAVVLAAGEGQRMGAGRPKQYLALGGRALFLHSLDFFLRLPDVDEVCLVLDRTGWEGNPRLQAGGLAQAMARRLVFAIGGARRQDSALAGLRALAKDTEIALVHDCARPFPPREPTEASIQAARECGGAILAAPATDTVKMAAERERRIEQTLERSRLWLAQTPQTFRYAPLLEAMEAAAREGVELTDEAMAFERLGREVRIIPSTPQNLKITVPEDLRHAERVLAELEAGTKDRAVAGSQDLWI